MKISFTSIPFVFALSLQAGTAPAFEVASVKVAQPQGDNVRGGLRIDQGRVSFAYASLRDLMSRAYEVKAPQITGPAWIDTERYDVEAKIPDGVPREQIPAMLRTLIEERFHLKMHRESKEMPVYELMQGKDGVKLDKAAEPTAPTRMNMQGNGDGIMHANINSTNMSTFSDMLGRWTDRPVIDKTGVTDKFDIKLDLSMEDLQRSRSSNVVVIGSPGPGAGSGGPAPEGNPAGSLFTSIQKLGLKLEAKRASLDLLIVDKAEKAPLEN
jgi:uncharacterized protein (TIGR03435 family)